MYWDCSDAVSINEPILKDVEEAPCCMPPSDRCHIDADPVLIADVRLEGGESPISES